MFGSHCRGGDARKCYLALVALQRTVDRGIVAITIGQLAERIHRSTRYTRSVLVDHPSVFFVGTSAALVRDNGVELRG